MNQRNEDLTTGLIIQKLLRFALPLLLGTLVQQLYSTVDLIFAGNVIDKTASAAIGASTLLITCLIGFFGGLAVGAGVVIAQSWGERDTDKLRRAIGNTAALALAGGIVLALLGWLLAPGYLCLIRTPEEIRANAEVYLRIYFLSLPSIIAYNFGAGRTKMLKRILGYNLKVWFFGCTGMMILGQLLKRQLIMLFMNPETYTQSFYDLTYYGLTVEFFAPIFTAGCIIINRVFVGLSAQKVATILSILRNFVFRLSITWLLPALFGAKAVWYCFPLSEALGFTCAAIAIVMNADNYGYGKSGVAYLIDQPTN